MHLRSPIRNDLSCRLFYTDLSIFLPLSRKGSKPGYIAPATHDDDKLIAHWHCVLHSKPLLQPTSKKRTSVSKRRSPRRGQVATVRSAGCLLKSRADVRSGSGRLNYAHAYLPSRLEKPSCVDVLLLRLRFGPSTFSSISISHLHPSVPYSSASPRQF